MHAYVSAFGAEATEDQTYNFDTTFFDVVGYRQDIYSDMEFIIIAGEVDENGQVAESAVKSLLFKTKKAGVAPYDIKVSVGNIGSMTADITIEPEEGIERFRYLVASRADFDYTAFEGEASVRRMIIGEWDNFTNESTKAITVNATGLKPNTEYQVGIVGFDKELREKVLLYDFTTGEPTGPKPTLAVETQTVETPWNKAAFKVNATYAVAMTAGVFPKGSIDEVLGRPGNENLTAGDVIYNNGTQLTEQEVASAMSEEGLVIESGEASAQYRVRVRRLCGQCRRCGRFRNSGVHYPFTAAARRGSLRAKLPGRYTATTKDSNGDPVTFSVTIATGVNEATEKALFRSEPSGRSGLRTVRGGLCQPRRACSPTAGQRPKRRPMRTMDRSGSLSSTATKRFRRVFL